jgi:hypothetical protein
MVGGIPAGLSTQADSGVVDAFRASETSGEKGSLPFSCFTQLNSLFRVTMFSLEDSLLLRWKIVFTTMFYLGSFVPSAKPI